MGLAALESGAAKGWDEAMLKNEAAPHAALSVGGDALPVPATWPQLEALAHGGMCSVSAGLAAAGFGA